MIHVRCIPTDGLPTSTKSEVPFFFFQYPLSEDGIAPNPCGHWSKDSEDYTPRNELINASYEQWETGYTYTQEFDEAQTEITMSVSLSRFMLYTAHCPIPATPSFI